MNAAGQTSSPSVSWATVLATTVRLLTFRATREELISFTGKHLALGTGVHVDRRHRTILGQPARGNPAASRPRVDRLRVRALVVFVANRLAAEAEALVLLQSAGIRVAGFAARDSLCTSG